MSKDFKTHFELLKIDFGNQNRLTQEIIRFLLIITENDLFIGKRLIKLIFGKMASQKFINKGVHVALIEEKQNLLHFINNYLNSKDEANKILISIFKEQKFCEIKNKNLKKKIIKKKNLIFSINKNNDNSFQEDYLKHSSDKFFNKKKIKK